MSYFLFEVPNLQLVVTVLGWVGRLVLVYTGLIVTWYPTPGAILPSPECPTDHWSAPSDDTGGSEHQEKHRSEPEEEEERQQHGQPHQTPSKEECK